MQMVSQQTFDFIVIGSGATGSVVANRLSADPGTKVLVLEAGELDTNPNIQDIGGFVKLWGSSVDWQFATEDQPGMAGRQIAINQGKVLGGSTSLNAMMYVRGNPGNFDRWSKLGATGWDYDGVLPYFKSLEDYEGGASSYHGTGGALSIRDCPDAVMRSEEFLVGATQVGYDGPHWDYNGERQENGAGLLQFHIDKQGHRVSGATAFLAPIKGRSNLTIETGAEVTRLVLDKTKVVGVEYRQNGQTHQVNAVREVILSAGALQSPKLLMLSGIGPGEHLQEHGIPVVVDLPGVGQNLQDHLQLPIVFRTKTERPNTTLLTGNVLFVNTRTDQPDAPPDLQLNFTPSVPEPLAPILNFGVPVCIFLGILVQPKSVGEIRLRSSDPQAAPVIDPRYLSDPADVKTLAAGVELARTIAQAPAFAPLNDGEIVPGEADIEGFIRSQASTLWHPAGTCKIGQDSMAVVDPQLRVHGVEGLRVADASVMPTVTSGNTVAACLMIGEKLADLILSA
jgi:choline dehydrogenase